MTSLLVLALVWSAAAAAGEAPASNEQSFDLAVLPILQARCLECHNAKKRSGKLNLETALGVARGGEGGHVVVPGKLAESRLWERVDDDEMPPEEPLAADEKARLRAWIEQGAHGLPPAEQAGHAGDGRDHWAFQPPRPPAMPQIREAARVRTDIDRFIEAALEARGLTLAPDAAGATLIRRVSFDLTGLPPTPSEIAAFLADSSPDAYPRMVEHYLGSPHYGERWGKYWLDAAGYADSNGYFNADTDRPLAYRYRDYVIRAFNDDKPFDRFIIEQLAGDELAGYRRDADVTPELVDLYTATHFLRNAPDGTDSSDGNDDELLLDRFTVLEGTVQVIGSALLGLTFQCARCHDHKFEPISQAEYYGLQAILFPAYCPQCWVKAADRVVTIGTQAQRAEHRRHNEDLDAQIKALHDSLAAATAPLEKQLLAEQLATLDEPTRSAVAAALEKPDEARSADEKALLEKHQELTKIDDDRLAKRYPEFAALKESIAQRVAQLETQRPRALEKIAVFTEVAGDPLPHHVRVRGGYRDLGPEAPPGVPAALCAAGREYVIEAKPEGRFSSGRRTALARWLTSPEHPLLARVTVNRLWQYHFGTGIVATSDNFGYTGAEPTHRELLDYLAVKFTGEGWSSKALHRLILNSSAYRQASDLEPRACAVDPENKLLWRYPVRRLDAEAVRDAMLAASGELDRTLCGPFVPTKRLADGGVVVDEAAQGSRRRSLYLQQRRSQMTSLLEVFDSPGMVTTCPRRNTSTIVLQSLSVLNSDFVLKRAAAFAERLTREAGSGRDDRVALAYLLTQARMPDAEERAAIDDFFRTQPARYTEQENADARVWRDFCQMLLAGNAFLYLD